MAKRVPLTDQKIAAVPLLGPGQRHRIQDAAEPRLWLEVTSKNRTYIVRKERGGRTMDVRIGRAPGLLIADARLRAAEILNAVAKGEEHRRPKPTRGATLQVAWEHYKKTLVRGRKPKSPRTIGAYQDAYNKLSAFHDVPLKHLADDPQRAVDEHERITKAHGAATADATMRFLRATYRAFAKSRLDRSLRPEQYPTSAIVWHNKTRTDKGFGSRELKAWFRQLVTLDNPVRREMHWFTLLTGIRRGDVRGEWESSGITTLRWTDIDLKARTLVLSNAKGAKAITLPLSRAAARSLLRAREAGRVMHAAHADEWVFPSAVGRISETKESSWSSGEKRTRLSSTGHSLRHAFRTLGAAAGVERFRVKLLMGHALDADVTDSYANVPALQDQLREAAEAIAAFITKHVGGNPDAALKARVRPI